MSAPITVTSLIDQVRDQTDEFSTVNVTDSDILQCLNRAQYRAVNILARHYADPYMASTSLELTSNVSEYDLPEDLFEDRVATFEIIERNRTWPIRRITYRDIHEYETSTSTTRPLVYSIVGRKVQFYPKPSGESPARMWYFRSPESLVQSQGRIEYIDITNNELHVDSIGEILSTVTDDLNSYINVIDAQTGEVKATMQIKTINGDEIALKTVQSGRRSSVHNKEIVYSIPETINIDDYICLASGTCVPFFAEGISNFLIQYAVAEIRRRLEDNPDIEQRVLAEFTKRVESQWVGRQVQKRVARRSQHWYRRLKRPYPRGT